MMFLTRRWMGVAAVTAVVVSPAVWSHAAAAQDANIAVTEKTAEGIRDHIDEAEDIVETMLNWRHVPTAVRRTDGDVVPPTAPADTLMAIDRSEIERVSALLSAAAVMLPRAVSQPAGPRGDLRAHVEKAQAIVREMLPAGGPAPVGTSGRGRDIVTVDRTALQRLDVELDAIEMIAPRQLQQR